MVDDVGPDVGGFAAGDEVAILTTALQPQPTFGSHAEYVVVPQESAVLLPRGSDLIAWSTLLMNSLTARMALELLNLDTDSVVAVTGAAGAVGAYAVQLAKRRGHTVVADAADKDRDLVAVLGADHVVARSDNFARLVREVATDGVAGVVDAALVGAALHPAVRDGGTVACLRPTDGPTQRGIRWEWPFVPDELTNTRALEELRDFAASGALALRVSKTYTPEQAPQAYRAVLRGGLRGRPVIVFDPGYPNFHVQAGE
ncbi:NADP-dependent oxidoreductase [Williamsia maris]